MYFEFQVLMKKRPTTRCDMQAFKFKEIGRGELGPNLIATGMTSIFP